MKYAISILGNGKMASFAEIAAAFVCFNKAEKAKGGNHFRPVNKPQ